MDPSVALTLLILPAWVASGSHTFLIKLYGMVVANPEVWDFQFYLHGSHKERSFIGAVPLNKNCRSWTSGFVETVQQKGLFFFSLFRTLQQTCQWWTWGAIWWQARLCCPCQWLTSMEKWVWNPSSVTRRVWNPFLHGFNLECVLSKGPEPHAWANYVNHTHLIIALLSGLVVMWWERPPW